MIVRGRLLLLPLVLVLLFCRPRVLIADSLDLWNAYTVDFPLLKNRTLSWSTLFETRFRDDISDFYRFQFYLGPVYDACENLSLSIRYGYIDEEKDETFQSENRFMLYLVPGLRLSDLGIEGWHLGGLSVRCEIRLDFRFRPSMDETFSWRFRLVPSASYPVRISRHVQLKPVVKQAVYMDFEDGLSRDPYVGQTRTVAGIAAEFHEHFRVSLSYIWLNQRSGPGEDWDGSNVIQTGLGYTF